MRQWIFRIVQVLIVGLSTYGCTQIHDEPGAKTAGLIFGVFFAIMTTLIFLKIEQIYRRSKGLPWEPIFPPDRFRSGNDLRRK